MREITYCWHCQSALSTADNQKQKFIRAGWKFFLPFQDGLGR